MTVKEAYEYAILNNEISLLRLFDFLLYEKGVIELNDDIKKVLHFQQPQFRKAMNEHLKSFDKKWRKHEGA